MAVVSLERFRVQKQIRLDAAPAAVLAHPAKPAVFILTPDTGTVVEIDGGTLAATRRARAGNRAAGMLLSPRQDALWVLYRDPAVLVELPFDSFQPRRRIRLAAAPDLFDVVLTKDHRALAAVASIQNQSIAIVSLDRAVVERTIAAGAEPSLLRFQPLDGDQLLVGNAPQRSLTIFHTASGETVVRLPLSIEPQHFCFDSEKGQLFITGKGMDAVVIVFPYTTEVDQTILAGRAPGAMASTDPNAATKPPQYLLVANPDTNSVTALDVDTRMLVAVVQVGQGPGEIVITPDGQYALVLNQISGDLAVIRIMSLATMPTGAQRRYTSAPLFTLIPVGETPVSAAVVM